MAATKHKIAFYVTKLREARESCPRKNTNLRPCKTLRELENIGALVA